MSTNRETCFVIMPFSKTTKDHTKSYWTKHFKFLKSLIEECPDLEAHRSKALRGDILGEIITNLLRSPVVVADLTDHNPNVYWELGVRQSFKHGTVTIAEERTKPPFDVSTKATLFYYPKNHFEDAAFRRDFKEAIQDCLANPDRPDSNVLETIYGRGTLFEIFRRDQATRRLDAVLSECSTNLHILNRAVKLAKKNQAEEDRKKHGCSTERLRVSAGQLLITDRYIDEDQSFFKSAEESLAWYSAINEQLRIWSLSPDSAELWLLRNAGQGVGVIGRFETRARAAQETLSKRF